MPLLDTVSGMDDVRGLLESMPPTFTTPEAEGAGLSRHVLARLVRRGEVSKVQRGLYRRQFDVILDEPRWLRVERDHLLRAAAALRVHPRHAISHLTNALARGWPAQLHPESLVHLTAITVRPRSRRVGDRFLHHSDSVINDLELVAGLPALTAARTVADCLRTMPVPAGVAVADASVRSGTPLTDVLEVLDAQQRWVGRPRAVSAVPLVDSRRESWLESWSFVRLWERGFDLPTPQVEVYDEVGRFVARVDGMWITDATVAECDGQGKYRIPIRDSAEATADSAVDRVLAERSRERSLLDLGLQVARWDNDEIHHDLDAVVRRVARAQTEGDLRRFRGHLRVDGEWVDLTEHRKRR